jgi:hypothetical protein
MTDQKHSWTEQELWVVCVCYKENLPIELALRLTNTTNEKSMEMRYRNCLFLDKGRVEGSLSHASRKHVEAWENVVKLYDRKDQIENNSLFIETVLLISIMTCVMLIIHLILIA